MANNKVIDDLVEEILKHPSLKEVLQLEIKDLRADLFTVLEERIESNVITISKIDPITKEQKTEDLGPQHFRFPELLKAIQLNIPVYIWGPTGSGKTMATETCSKALSLPFYRKVVSSQSSEGTIFGFHNGTSYIEGIAYKPYKDGGLLLIDEIDNGNPNINVCVKMLVEGNSCIFPCGRVNRHKDFRLVSNANTIGTGANRQYVGRSAQDQALLNIFAFISWDYDLPFEETLTYNEYYSWHGEDHESLNSFIASARAIRRSVEETGIKHIVSPRNLINGARMLAQKFDPKLILESVILRGLEQVQAEKLLHEHNKHIKEEQEKITRKIETKKQLPEKTEDNPKIEDMNKNLVTAFETALKKHPELVTPDTKQLVDIFVQNINDQIKPDDAF